MSDRETNVSIWEGALTSTCSAAATTITVDATAGVPAVPFFVVVEPSSDSREVILIDDSTTGTSLVMSSAASRAQDGTVDAEHAIGTTVGIYPVPSHWTDINDRVDGALTEADIDTLAELNAIVTDATLLSTDGGTLTGDLAGPKFVPSITTLATSGTVDIDFSGADLRTQGLVSGDVTYTGSNHAPGRSVTIRIANGGGERALTFPTGWHFVGQKPATLADYTYALLTLTAFGAADNTVMAAWGVEL